MLPEQNRKDWEEAPKEVQSSMEAHFFEDILKAIEFSLTPAVSKKKK
jgi:ATP-dependent Lon protease